MTLDKTLINPALDIAHHARVFSDGTRVQVRDFLTSAAAQ